jgi:hypothetical protein
MSLLPYSIFYEFPDVFYGVQVRRVKRPVECLEGLFLQIISDFCCSVNCPVVMLKQLPSILQSFDFLDFFFRISR